jgi:fatty-acyl-CoA synthase
MTETSPGATSLSPAMTRAKQGSVGLPHFFTEVRIADENGRMVPRGTVGEIEITGPNVFAGYLGLPDATAAAFTADGWFRSGDLGYLDDDGYLFIADRLKDLIISGGENIYPAEVENLISDIEGVSGVAVVGVPDERWGEVPWAVVTVRDGADIDTETVRARLDGVLARYKLPKNVVVVEELPRTASGKVRKADLRERFGRH